MGPLSEVNHIIRGSKLFCRFEDKGREGFTPRATLFLHRFSPRPAERMASVLTRTLPSPAATHSSFNILDDRDLGLGSFDDCGGDSSATTTPDRNPAGLAHIRALQETCVNVAQNAKSGSGHLLFSQPAEVTNTSLTLNLDKLRISESTSDEKDSDNQQDCTPQHPALAKKLPARPTIGSETFYPPSDEDQTASPSLGGTILEVAGSDVGTCGRDSLEPIIEGAPLEARKTNEVDGIFEGMAPQSVRGPATGRL